jgi:hypothetical protein
MPWQALFDYDFAENFTIIVRDEIQSEYWISIQITLFIGISQHLDMSAWNDLEKSRLRCRRKSLSWNQEKHHFGG